MLRHAGALRPGISCCRRDTVPRALKRTDVAPAAGWFLGSKHGSVRYPNPNPNRSPLVSVCCYLHHDARRRRDGTPPIPRAMALPDTSGKIVWERGVLTAIAGAQRVSSSGGRAEGTAEQPKSREATGSTMDEETRKSIGKSDELSKKSMKTVKVGERWRGYR